VGPGSAHGFDRGSPESHPSGIGSSVSLISGSGVDERFFVVVATRARPPKNSPVPSGLPRRRSLLRRIRISRPSTYRPFVRKDSVQAKRSWTHKPGLGGSAPTEARCTKSLRREP
jgi:hypothetical protein